MSIYIHKYMYYYIYTHTHTHTQTHTHTNTHTHTHTHTHVEEEAVAGWSIIDIGNYYLLLSIGKLFLTFENVCLGANAV